MCLCVWVAGAKSKAKAGAGAPTPGGGPATKEGAGGAGAGAAPGSTGGGNALRHLVGVERLVDRLGRKLLNTTHHLPSTVEGGVPPSPGLSRDESNASTGTTNTSNTDFTGSTSGSVLGSSSRGRSSSAATAASSVIDADARSGPSPARSVTSPALAALVRKQSAGELPPVHPGKLARTQSEFTRHEEARLLNAQGGGGASDDSPRQMRRVQDFVMVTKGFKRDDSGNTMREAVMFRASTRAGSLSVATPQREAVRTLKRMDSDGKNAMSKMPRAAAGGAAASDSSDSSSGSDDDLDDLHDVTDDLDAVLRPLDEMPIAEDPAFEPLSDVDIADDGLVSDYSDSDYSDGADYDQYHTVRAFQEDVASQASGEAEAARPAFGFKPDHSSSQGPGIAMGGATTSRGDDDASSDGDSDVDAVAVVSDDGSIDMAGVDDVGVDVDDKAPSTSPLVEKPAVAVPPPGGDEMPVAAAADSSDSDSSDEAVDTFNLGDTLSPPTPEDAAGAGTAAAGAGAGAGAGSSARFTPKTGKRTISKMGSMLGGCTCAQGRLRARGCLLTGFLRVYVVVACM